MLHAPPVACRRVRRLAAALPIDRASDDVALRDGGPGARLARTHPKAVTVPRRRSVLWALTAAADAMLHLLGR